MDTLYSSLTKSEISDLNWTLDRLEETEYNKVLPKLNDLSIFDSKDQYKANQKKLCAIAFVAIASKEYTPAQYASFNIYCSAILDLIDNCQAVSSYEYGMGGKRRGGFNGARIEKGLPDELIFLNMEHNCIHPSVSKPVGLEFQTPLLKKFFALDDEEWAIFLEKMEGAPISEKLYPIFHAPKTGTWSNIVCQIQKILKGFQSQTFLYQADNGFVINETRFPVPSFTMFQVFMDVKGLRHQESRRKITLIPTFGQLTDEMYANYKMNDLVACGLKTPLSFTADRISIDDYPNEGYTALLFHDIFHALRVQIISPSLFDLCKTWYKIAVIHPNNKKEDDLYPVSSILIDAEFDDSYPKDPKSPIKDVGGLTDGTLFDMIVGNLQTNWHKDLRYELIKSVVEGRVPPYGREDLPPSEQDLYDQISQKITPPPPKLKTIYDTLPRSEQIRLYEAFKLRTNDGVADSVKMVNTCTMYKETNWSKADCRKRAVDLQFALQENLITMIQIASYQIFEMAKWNIHLDPTYVTYVQIDENKMTIPVEMQVRSDISLLRMSFKDSGSKEILKKYFHLNESEWDQFCAQLDQTLGSEHYFHLFELPKGEVEWSNHHKSLQQTLNCFHPQEYTYNGNKCRVLPVASFSMYQIFLNIKAQKRGTTFTLIPSYTPSNPEFQLKLLNDNSFKVLLYFPKYDWQLHYDKADPDYQSIRDGSKEGPLSRFKMGLVSALYEIEMSEDWNLIRQDFVSIATENEDYDAANKLASTLFMSAYPHDSSSVFINAIERTNFDNLFKDVKFTPKSKAAIKAYIRELNASVDEQGQS